MSGAQRACYKQGMDARKAGQGLAACPYGLAETGLSRAYWLAGWHDQDIALKGAA